MKNQLAGFLLLAGAIVSPASDSVLVESVEIVEHGIFQAEHTGENVAVGTTATGLIRLARNAVLKQETDQVPTQLGTSFGCFFTIQGQPKDSPARVTIQVHHPAMTKPDGTVTGTTDYVPSTFPIGQRVGYVYTFDYEWEMVPGPWAIQVWWDGTKLAERRFTVVRSKP